MGGWANYDINNKISFQAELLGSWQGGDINYNEIANPISDGTLKPTGKMRLPYIMMPLMVQYIPMDDFYVEAGAQLNYLPKVNITAFLNGQEVDDEQAANLITNRLENVNNFDVGLNIGAGYEVVPDWVVYMRYTHGLITVDNREVDQRDLKNRVIALGVNYKIKL